MEDWILEQEKDEKSIFNNYPFKLVDKDTNNQTLREKVIKYSFVIAFSKFFIFKPFIFINFFQLICNC